ncbi:RNA-binding transcriptional accessory protein [Desulfuromonas acetoxidans]|nr:Tex family protein [Desulfuromonas acetoxidans]MBF0646232.1 RNA-binding transcriptional accessory protein [Desulfuromonas acetoxidans]NVD25076.1 RNA-binding transcriptional accessory protein [Desulfuromonas acetoxidans]NVE17121.1 RNA-binding transcriptional accessory protein [Desulfuromonas acetoxidans]
MAREKTTDEFPLEWLCEESGLASWQVQNCTTLLTGGATVPFIARYRKEQTGELDEVKIRQLQERLQYYHELAQRKQTILNTIEESGKLSDELRGRIAQVRDKAVLEDLYLPYKPRRRTRATMARERGLEPLALSLVRGEMAWSAIEQLADQLADQHDELADGAAALKGAGDILAEQINEQAVIRARVRHLTWQHGVLVSRVAANYANKPSKYESYYEASEPLKQIPSHRMLALRRGEGEEVLRLTLETPRDEILKEIARLFAAPRRSPWQEFFTSVVADAYDRLLAPSIEVELRLEAKKIAEEAAIAVFADNLRHVLLAPAAGEVVVLGIDPGLRTGSKLAVVSATGAFLDHVTIYPHTQKAQQPQFSRQISALIEKYAVEMVAVGNGTGGREMEQFVRQSLRDYDHSCPVVMVNEAGASVYSASEIAREEFPDLDITVRGAISIARRLQDPLAELVKIDPKSIGVGQYQHDVNQRALKQALDAVVESCVNYVGGDLNTASAALLGYVSGIGPTLAKAIARERDQRGGFVRRCDLLDVPRLGAKAYEQAAGFLRVKGAHPLDNSAVHPENYALVEQMAADLAMDVASLIGAADKIKRLDLQRYVCDEVGLPTLRDIRDELLKPGRDPRRQFETASFRDDVQEMSDLQPGMVLQGSVTNVAAFGAFVDIGVHQDGLVHISELADRFVKNPAEIVKVGQVVHVKVLSVDTTRKRISLSIKQAGASA